MIRKFVKDVLGAVDLRDVFVFGGLALVGYGLYRFLPWVAYTVCGAVLVYIGLFESKGSDR